MKWKNFAITISSLALMGCNSPKKASLQEILDNEIEDFRTNRVELFNGIKIQMYMS